MDSLENAINTFLTTNHPSLDENTADLICAAFIIKLVHALGADNVSLIQIFTEIPKIIEKQVEWFKTALLEELLALIQDN